MNTKELGELRRRFRPEKSAVSRIYGCYVNTAKEIISKFETPLGLASEEEASRFLGLLRKSLTGTMGRNLMDINFTPQQVMDSEEHKLLSTLRRSALQDHDALDTFYQKIVDVLALETNYVILLATDAYDVPHRAKDDTVLEDASETTFTYMICSVCPVKDGKTELSYSPSTNEFHTSTFGQVVGAPEMGFLFPAFDDRATNLYAALWYSRNPAELHQEVIDVLFHVTPPMSAPDQKEAFGACLTEAMDDKCTFDVVQAVHESLRERIVAHKESKDPEPLTVSPKEMGSILSQCGADDDQVKAFVQACGEQFGQSDLSPANLIDSGRFKVSTTNTTITVDPAHSALVHTRIIDGRKYILIPADDGVEVNGLPCGILG